MEGVGADAGPASAVAAEIVAAGGGAIADNSDVATTAGADTLVDAAVEHFGRVDILVNNAGTAWASPPEDMPLDGWQKVIDVNLTGAFLFAQSVGRVLIRQGEGGRIVNVASVAAFRGAPQAAMNALPYNASKAGVVGLTIDLAVKWAPHGITVNAIAPGWFPTEMTAHTLDAAGERLLSRLPLGRYGGPDDLKGAVVYLASAASGYVTGTTLIVDGGQSAS
jgi:gluconate 5-dehydrogenase